MLVHSSELSTKQKYLRFIAVAQLVPKGCVATYSQVAFMADLPGRARMVGKALGCTMATDATPWHRIIRADGRIAFAAETLHFVEQYKRLTEENVVVRNGRVNLKYFQWEPDADSFLLAFSKQLKLIMKET